MVAVDREAERLAGHEVLEVARAGDGHRHERTLVDLRAELVGESHDLRAVGAEHDLRPVLGAVRARGEDERLLERIDHRRGVVDVLDLQRLQHDGFTREDIELLVPREFLRVEDRFVLVVAAEEDDGVAGEGEEDREEGDVDGHPRYSLKLATWAVEMLRPRRLFKIKMS